MHSDCILSLLQLKHHSLRTATDQQLSCQRSSGCCRKIWRYKSSKAQPAERDAAERQQLQRLRSLHGFNLQREGEKQKQQDYTNQHYTNQHYTTRDHTTVSNLSSALDSRRRRCCSPTSDDEVNKVLKCISSNQIKSWAGTDCCIIHKPTCSRIDWMQWINK